MREAVAIVSVLAQAAFFVSFFAMMYEILNVPDAFIDAGGENLEPVKDHIATVLVRYRPVLGIGVVGAILSWIALRHWHFRPQWFLTVTRVFGWTWIPFIPIGTGLGILILSGRANELELQDASATKQ